MHRRFTIFVALALLLPIAPVLGAESVVWFADGRAMKVESIEMIDGVAHVKLASGIEMAIPESRIDRIGDAPRVQQVVAAPTTATRPAGRQAGNGWRQRAGRYANLVYNTANRHNVDPVLLTAMAQVESAWNPRAVSHKGAQGLMQLMPATAKRFGVQDSFDPAQNLDGGARYMRWLLDRFEGDTELALAGYNAGEGAVDRHSGIPPFPETQNYVVKVLANVDALAQ